MDLRCLFAQTPEMSLAYKLVAYKKRVYSVSSRFLYMQVRFVYHIKMRGFLKIYLTVSYALGT